jgi:hypothetical protein
MAPLQTKCDPKSLRKKMMRHTIATIQLTIMLLLVSGCGGGGGGGAINPPANTVSGVAAQGAVIAGDVYLKDSATTPRELHFNTADGNYKFDVTGLTKPFLLKVVGGTQTLYSLAPDQGTANINPMSNLVVAVAAAAAGKDPAGVYAAGSGAVIQGVGNKMGQALVDVRSTLNPILVKYQVATVDPITSSYTANGTGLDHMLDLVTIVVDNSGGVAITDTGNVATSGSLPIDPINKDNVAAFTAHAIYGKVASANNFGLAGVTVSIKKSGATSGVSAVTDGNGRYIVTGLANGSYTVTAARTDVYNNLSAVSFDIAAKDVTIDDTAPAGSTANANFTATTLSSFTLSGNVKKYPGAAADAAMPGVIVTLTTKNFTSAPAVSVVNTVKDFSTVTDADGNFSISGLPGAFYAITLSLTGQAFALNGHGDAMDNVLLDGADLSLIFTGRPTSDANGGVGGF